MECSSNKSVVAAILLALISLWMLSFCYVAPFWYRDAAPSGGDGGTNVTYAGLWGVCWRHTGPVGSNGSATTALACSLGPQYLPGGNDTLGAGALYELAAPDPVVPVSVVVLLLATLACLASLPLGAVYVCCRPGAPSHLLAAAFLLLLAGMAALMVIARLYRLGDAYIGLQVGLAGGAGAILAGLVYMWKLWKVFTAPKMWDNPSAGYSRL